MGGGGGWWLREVRLWERRRMDVDVWRLGALSFVGPSDCFVSMHLFPRSVRREDT